MKQTYTKEQLEAFRDCLCRCFDKGQCQLISKCIQPSNLIKTLAADLLSANEEIERLRESLELFAYCTNAPGIPTKNAKGETIYRSCREPETGLKPKDWCRGCRAAHALGPMAQ